MADGKLIVAAVDVVAVAFAEVGTLAVLYSDSVSGVVDRTWLFKSENGVLVDVIPFNPTPMSECDTTWLVLGEGVDSTPWLRLKMMFSLVGGVVDIKRIMSTSEELDLSW